MFIVRDLHEKSDDVSTEIIYLNAAVCVMLPFFSYIKKMTTLEDKSLWEAENDNDIGQDILRLAPEEISNRTRLLENDVKVSHNQQVISKLIYVYRS